MRFDEIKKTQRLISESTILSLEEKNDWLDLLSEMNDQQVSELILILNSARPFPMARQAPAPQQRPQMPRVDIREKQIPTSQPLYELDLPAPAPMPTPAPMPAPVPMPVQTRPSIPVVHGVSEEMMLGDIIRPSKPSTPLQSQPQQKVQPKAIFPSPAALKPTAASAPAVAPAPAMSAAPAPAAPPPAPAQRPILEIPLRTPQDFTKLTPQMLHGKDPYAVLQEVLNNFAEASRNQKFVEVLENLEQSPLQTAYLNFGMDMLNTIPGSGSNSTGDAGLSKEEFEAFADFRRELDQILI